MEHSRLPVDFPLAPSVWQAPIRLGLGSLSRALPAWRGRTVQVLGCSPPHHAPLALVEHSRLPLDFPHAPSVWREPIPQPRGRSQAPRALPALSGSTRSGFSPLLVTTVMLERSPVTLGLICAVHVLPARTALVQACPPVNTAWQGVTRQVREPTSVTPAQLEHTALARAPHVHSAALEPSRLQPGTSRYQCAPIVAQGPTPAHQEPQAV